VVSTLISRLSGLGLSAGRALALIGDTFQCNLELEFENVGF